MSKRTYYVESEFEQPVRFSTEWHVDYDVEHRTVCVYDYNAQELIAAFTDVTRWWEEGDEQIELELYVSRVGTVD